MKKKTTNFMQEVQTAQAMGDGKQKEGHSAEAENVLKCGGV